MKLCLVEAVFTSSFLHSGCRLQVSTTHMHLVRESKVRRRKNKSTLCYFTLTNAISRVRSHALDLGRTEHFSSEPGVRQLLTSNVLRACVGSSARPFPLRFLTEPPCWSQNVTLLGYPNFPWCCLLLSTGTGCLRLNCLSQICPGVRRSPIIVIRAALICDSSRSSVSGASTWVHFVI